MAMTKTMVSVALGKGLETKQDPKQLQAGAMTMLKNAVFTSPGRLKKRPGTAAKSSSIFSGGSVAQGGSVFSLGDQLLSHDGRQLYAWNETGDNWVPVSKHTGTDGLTSIGVPSIQVTREPVTSYSWNLAHPDMAIHASGYVLTVWENPSSDLGGGLFWTLYDSNTNTRLYSDQPTPVVTTVTDQRSPKVHAIGNYLVAFFVNAQKLYYAAINTTNVSAGFGAPVLIHSDLPSDATQRNYDVSKIGGRLVIVCNRTSTVAMSSLTSALVLTTNTATFTGPASACITVFDYLPAGDPCIVWGDGTGLYKRHYASNLVTVVSGAELIETVPALSVTAINYTATRTAFLYTLAPPNKVPTYNYRVRVRLRDSNTGWLAAGSDLCRSVGLAGKAFTYGTDAYVPVLYDSIVQPTGFLLDLSGRPVAKWLQGTAGGQLTGPTNLTSTTLLPEVNVIGSAFTLAAQETTNGGSNLIDAVSLNFTNTPLSRAVLANTLHFGGGIMWMFDGASTVEHGFLVFPEQVGVPNPGGIRRYFYTTTYEWTDNNGFTHRSSPSVPVLQAQATAIDAATNSVPVSLPTLRVTAKQNNNVDAAPHLRVQMVLYRTIDGGSEFFRCLDINQESPYNSITADVVNVLDTTTDEQLISHQRLYTEGGVVENIAVNPPAAMAQVKNRLWVLDSTNPFTLWFTKEVKPGMPAEFSDLFTLNLESHGGPATAIANLDEKVIVLRERSMSYIAGLGPDATGASLQFEEIPIPSDTGCLDPRSVVIGTPGIIYKSHKGFYKLGRDLSVTYVGAQVEAFNQYTCTGAVALPKTTWMLFTMSNGSALLFDYLMDQWSTYDNVSAIDAVLWQNLFTWVNSSGVVRQENPASFDDDGAYVPVSFTTGWLNLNGLNGFGRMWNLLVLGEWKSPHRLKIELAVDYNEAVVQTATFDAPVLVKPYQWKVDCVYSAIQAVQITITELPYDASTGEGLNLSGISMEIGVRPTMYKPSSDRKG